jgi:hypothetical protein
MFNLGWIMTQPTPVWQVKIKHLGTALNLQIHLEPQLRRRDNLAAR